MSMVGSNLTHARARACHNTVCKLQYACKVPCLLEHRGEGTDLEFGKCCPHFTAPSYRQAAADLQNFWLLENENAFP